MSMEITSFADDSFGFADAMFDDISEFLDRCTTSVTSKPQHIDIPTLSQSDAALMDPYAFAACNGGYIPTPAPTSSSPASSVRDEDIAVAHLEAEFAATLWGTDIHPSQVPGIAPSAESVSFTESDATMQSLDQLARSLDDFLAQLPTPYPDANVMNHYFGAAATSDWCYQKTQSLPKADLILEELLAMPEQSAPNAPNAAIDTSLISHDCNLTTSPIVATQPFADLSAFDLEWPEPNHDLLSAPPFPQLPRRNSDASTSSFESDVSTISTSSLDSLLSLDFLDSFSSPPAPMLVSPSRQPLSGRRPTRKSINTKPSRAPKSHVCHLCPRAYTRKFNLKSHIQAAHTGIRPFVCTYCSTSFARKHDLRRHEACLHAMSPHQYKCSCGMTFARSDALKRHLGVEKKKAVEEGCEMSHWNAVGDLGDLFGLGI